jgi:hypothetical protein
MQQRKSLVELAQEVENQKAIKKDFIVPSQMISMNEDTSLHFGDNVYNTGTVAHEQLAAKLEIPKKYYDRMRNEKPHLLAENVNAWLAQSDDKRMVRVLGDKARAILSDKYRPIDYDVILEAVLPTLMNHGRELKIISSEITERKMYLQVVSPKLEGEVKKGDVVQMGLSIQTSDVGLGAVNIDPYLYRLICLNGATLKTAIRKYHVGKRIEADEMGFFSAETLTMDNEVFIRKLRETVEHSFNELDFQETLKQISFTADNKIVEEIPKVIKEVTKRYDLSKGEGDSLLKNLINGGDLSQWGLGNAVTQMANEVKDYDRAMDYQKIGGQIIELGPNEFRAIGG